MAALMNQNPDNLVENLKRVVLDKMGSQKRLQAAEELGLFDDTLVVKLDTPLNTLAHHLEKRLAYGKNERDLVILRHDIDIAWPNNSKVPTKYSA